MISCMPHGYNTQQGHLQEQKKKPIMQARVLDGVEDGQEDQTGGPGNGEEDREDSACLVEETFIRNELASVSQPPFRQKGQIQEDNHDHASSDEERLQPLRTYIGNEASESVSIAIPSNCRTA